MAKGSSEELRKSFDILVKTTYLVGINPFTPNRDVTVRFVISVLLLLTLYLLCAYTAWELRSEWQTAMEVLGYFMTIILGTNKMWLGFVQKPSYYLLFVGTEEIYTEFNTNDRNKPELRKTVNLLANILKIMVAVYSGGFLILMLAIIVIMVMTNEKLLVLRLYFPFVDHTTMDGFVFTLCLQMFLLAYGVNGFLAADTAFMTTIVPLIGYANSFKNEVDSLNQLLENPNIDSSQSSEQLMRIIKLHKMIVEYQISVIALFKAANLTQTFLNAALMLVLVFMSFTLHYYQALSFLLPVFFELTLYCSLGTIIKAKVRY